ncbi:MAG: hypothetical protein ACREJ3_17075, partial [Polyangiaceae bacterium]
MRDLSTLVNAKLMFWPRFMSPEAGIVSGVTHSIAAARRSALAIVSRGSEIATVTGKDRQTWLNGLVTCDLMKIRSGEAVYGLVVARSGRILADPVIMVGDESIAVVISGGAQDLLAHLDHYTVMEEVETHADIPAPDVWAVHGPL